MQGASGNETWTWTTAMDSWFRNQFLHAGPEDRGTEPTLAQLLPDLPGKILLEESPLLLWGDLLF